MSSDSPKIVVFGCGRRERFDEPERLLGVKGATLHRLAGLGFPVPPGVIITTSFPCRGEISSRFVEQVLATIASMRTDISRYGGLDLFSVRCSPVVSIPGLMPAILNIGVTSLNYRSVTMASGNPSLGAELLCRLIASYANATAGVSFAEFQSEAEAVLVNATPQPAVLAELIERFKDVWKSHTGRAWPDDPAVQIRHGIEAALASWDSPVAAAYRRANGLSEHCRPAVIVQKMAFGNYDENSAVVSICTRDPATGENVLAGDFALASQGQTHEAEAHRPIAELRSVNAVAHAGLLRLKASIERVYRDAVDLDLVIERGEARLLNCRPANRTPVAAGRMACDMVRERLITKPEAILRVDPATLSRLLHPRVDPAADKTEIASGMAASPGAAGGQLAFSAEEVLARAGQGVPLILARVETEAADVAAMSLCDGILTTTGGMTSHAAVVARTMALPCIVGAANLHVDPSRRLLIAASGRSFGSADSVTLDGASGLVYAGIVPTIEPELPRSFRTLLRWADEFRQLGVLANADTPRDAETARAFGAQGIGLCRTEHMFFDPRRIIHMQRMILADGSESRSRALDLLLPLQRQDFVDIFQTMDGLPVTVRLLDPPLHEFLPRGESEQRSLAEELRLSLDELQHRIGQLRETNPMLGHRGCRLGITFPEIPRMQVRAIIEAACICRRRKVSVRPEIMIPLVCDEAELEYLRRVTCETAEAVFREQQTRIEFRFGAMIEVPRAALLAGEAARSAEFFSFGTNDLTQLTLGLSRDDAGRFLGDYLARGVFNKDPFQCLDQAGVGQLIAIAVKSGRRVRPGLKCGLCGEHGGDPASIGFCHDIGLDYVSTSPWRIPIARIAAAQAAIRKIAGTGRRRKV